MTLHVISKKVGISAKELIVLLQELSDEKLSFTALVSKTGLSIETLKKLKKEAPSLFLPIPNFFVLSQKGKEELGRAMSEKGEFKEEYSEKVLGFYNELEKTRPAPERSFDQFYSTPETQVKRLKFFIEKADLKNSSFLVLGDDDLTSVCLGITNLVQRLAVCDIDQRQLDLIYSLSKKFRFEADTYHFDFKRPMLSELKAKFDVVFTDPPYTKEGFRLFLDKAFSALNRTNGRIYICFGSSERSPERYLPIQEAINDYRLVIEEVHKNFNAYTGAESVGNRSSLYVLRPTPSSKSGRKVNLERIYTYE
ncbi:MAG: bis-aminopropyl spermidine synthase family protein [Patescibacteria group bacterium]